MNCNGEWLRTHAAYLDGKTTQQLLRLLRYPPSVARVRAKMRALGEEGRLAIAAVAAKV